MNKRLAIIDKNYAKIPLGKNAHQGYTLIDIEDSWIDEHFWQLHHSGYVTGIVNKKLVSLHRFIMDNPQGKEIDHINNDKLDNRKSNLRICLKTENRRNRSMNKNNTTGYKGVIKTRNNRFGVRIHYFGKTLSFGTHDTPQEAAWVYNEVVKVLHGSFAKLNVIRIYKMKGIQ